MRSDFQINDEPLAGYRLIERLGAGGYGEVWRTEAPGGLTKAIKLVFGQEHEKRAIRELKSLELIRQLRHPFLLSLERIEVVEGRLLIVTELADGSIKDRFDVCIQKGLPGIPREEMLRYMRDAADALDYMSEQHGLQHLDIKPENLLLLGDHLKVADFGLVKDVNQSNASLVGGLTPLYAAPEVFRGLPCQQSDQYSLAIVYQELLTGSLPFAGGSAAELTLQHLNDEPNLSSLSGAERYVISRALSKDAGHRYATCRDFVEALAQTATSYADSLSSSTAEATSSNASRGVKRAAKVSAPTEFLDDDETNDQTAGNQLLVELPPVDDRIVDLPSIQVDTRSFRPSPVLFLGIGGSAGRVLSHLRSQMNQQFGSEPVPAVQFLQIDTDPQALADVKEIDGPGLTLEETLNIPLRRSQHYRERWDQLLSWLSRRWLYNIPKSMRTEGLRPLGRLALVDHARQTCQRIRRGMMQAIEADSITASTAITGQEFRSDALRIYIVASASGGTGSGAVLDVAYAVRAMLKKIAVAQVSITGIVTHSTGRDPRHCELARVNAYSWLTEYHHFHQPAMSYPGDASCGLPAQEPDVSAFDETYFLHLGDGLEEREFDRATRSVADYLMFDALSPAQVSLDACRAKPELLGEMKVGVQSGGALRSFGIHHEATVSPEACEAAAELVSAHLLANWKESKAPNSTEATHHAGDGELFDSIGDEANKLVQRLHLTSSAIAANARSLVESQFDCTAETFLQNWLAERISSNQDSDARRWEVVDDIFGGAEPAVLGQRVADIVQPLADKLGEDVRRWVIERLDLPSGRLKGARESLKWLQHHLDSMLHELHGYRGSLAAALVDLRQSTQAEGNEAPAIAETSFERLSHCFELRLDEVGLRAADHITQSLLSELKVIGDNLTTFCRELGQIKSSPRSVAASERPSAGSSEVDAFGRQLAAIVSANMGELAASVDARLQCEFLDGQGGLYQVVLRGGRPRAQLSARIQEICRRAVQDTWSNASHLRGGTDSKEVGSKLIVAIEAATPTPLTFGGARRVLAVLPRGTDATATAKELSETAGVPVSAVEGVDGNTTVCVEAEGLSLTHLALSVIEQRRDSVEFAKRVHSRSDIAWTPLVTMPGAAADALPSGLTTVSMAIDPAVRQTEVL